MKKNKSNTQFWSVLALVNVLALTYPISLLLHANTVDENLFATLVFIGALLLLVVIDAISIVAESGLGASKS